MSYKIEPMPLITFLEDNKLKLPRFQRKSTWDKKQNFELCISVFQDYPIGVVIINKEQESSWLLDGRQRRNALTIMRENPVELYDWARNYIGFKKTADEAEVCRAYWEKIDEFLQAEQTTDGGNREIENSISIQSDDQTEENSFDSIKQREGLKNLLDLILMVHQVKPSGSKWESNFNFSKVCSKIKYAPIRTAGKIDPKILRKFILDFMKEVDQFNDGNVTQEAFIDYYNQNSNIDNENLFKKEVERRWDMIKKSLDVIAKSERIFSESRVGVIYLTNATPLDAQIIFSRVNGGGTQLKAEELLSAKPYWNKLVQNPSRKVIEDVKAMYKKLEINPPDFVVRWDIAATFIGQINNSNLIFDSYDESKRKNEISLDEVTLGFKLISSIYTEGMSNRHVIDLEKSKILIDWDNGLEDLVNDLNSLCKIISDDPFFKCLQVWKKPIAKLMTNAIALEFITILLKDWRDKECPISGGKMKSLQRDARILFDRLIFEYVTQLWRGSGDSKMSLDIKNWRARITPVEDDSWKQFIASACSGNYNGQVTTKDSMRPILYYYYVLNNKIPTIQTDIFYDVDHIIPQEKFNSNQMVDQSLKDSLINLALLPKRDNIFKGSKALNEIKDPWLKNQIRLFTGIEDGEFEEYSNITNIMKLKAQREEMFQKTFTTERKTILSN